VKECPQNDNAEVQCYPPTYMTNAPQGTYNKCQAKTQAGSWFRYDTIKVASSFCLPNGASYVNKETFDTIKGAFQSNIYGKTAARWAMNII